MTTATPTQPAPAKAVDPARNQPELFQLPIERIDPGPNVRQQVGDVDELAASVKAHGVLSPIRVEQAGAKDGVAHYALVYGQRRLAAAKAAGLTHIPALVDVDQRTGTALIVAQLLENLQREDLNPLDAAAAYRQLLDAGLSQRELARQLGIAQPTIAGTLRLLKLPDTIRAQVASGELSASHAKAIAALPDAEQAEVARRAVEHQLSSHQVEEEVRLATQRAAAGERRRDEARTHADAAEASLVKKKAAKEAAVVYSYDDDLVAELKRRGWTIAARSKYYGASKGCDCDSWSISIAYMGDGTNGVKVERSCRSQAHQDAAAKALEEAWAKDKAERKAKRAVEAQAERAQVAAAAAPIIERLTADAQLRARVALWSIAAGDGYGGAYDALEEEVGGWPEIAKLPVADVERWTLALLVDDVIDAPEVLATVVPPAPADGSQAAAAERVAAKRAAKKAAQ